MSCRPKARGRCSRRASDASGRPATRRCWQAGTAWRSRPSPKPGACPAANASPKRPRRAGEFLVGRLLHDGDRLSHSWKDGQAAGNGFLEDYACVVEGLLALYATTFSEPWFTAARALADSMLTHFARPEGGFYDTSDDHERLIVRPRSLHDSPTPCGNSIAASVLLKLAAYTGDGRYLEAAEGALAAASGLVSRAPMMGGQWLFALLLAETGATEVAIVGDLATPAGDDFLQVVRSTYRPFVAVAARPAGGATLVPILAGRELGPEEPAVAWVCRRVYLLSPDQPPEGARGLAEHPLTGQAAPAAKRRSSAAFQAITKGAGHPAP